MPFSAYLFYKYEGAGGELGLESDPDATGWPAARQAAALDPAGVVAQAQAMIDEFGFQSIKLKGGAFPPDEEADAILAMHEHFGPEMPLRLDPNAIWSVETALRIGERLAGALEYYEDPVRGQEAMAEVGRKLDMPLATNMCTTSFAALPNSLGLHSGGHHPQRSPLLGRAARHRRAGAHLPDPLAAASPCTRTATWGFRWRR